MANLVVGTKPGSFSSDKLPSSEPYGRVIRPAKRTIVYDICSAIPAIFMLLLWLLVLTGAGLFALTSRVSPSALKQLANQLAPGRIATNFIHGDETCRSDVSTNEWAERMGWFIIGFRHVAADPDGVAAEPEAEAAASEQSEKSCEEGKPDLEMVAVDDSVENEKTSLPVSTVMLGREDARSVDSSDVLREEKRERVLNVIEIGDEMRFS